VENHNIDPQVPAETFDSATVYFSAIDGFINLVAESTPLEVLFFLLPFFSQPPLVPLLHLGPQFFPIVLFGLTGMTGISVRIQWPLFYLPHGSFYQREQLLEVINDLNLDNYYFFTR
jgi:hypothetical protein